MNKIFIIIVGFCLLVTGVLTKDRLTWSLEIFPILIAAPFLILTNKKFPLTRIAYVFIFVHSLILIYGGMYTYANAPLGNWLKEFLHLSRNPYDRIGHFAQGFIPAVLAREILLRKSVLTAGKWLNVIVVCICLAFSAFYELIEWWSAIIMGQASDAFLGAQGDPWDTQWDMLFALIGGILSTLTINSLHTKQLIEQHFIRK